jgi:hypothetical protein
MSNHADALNTKLNTDDFLDSFSDVFAKNRSEAKIIIDFVKGKIGRIPRKKLSPAETNAFLFKLFDKVRPLVMKSQKCRAAISKINNKTKSSVQGGSQITPMIIPVLAAGVWWGIVGLSILGGVIIGYVASR